MTCGGYSFDSPICRGDPRRFGRKINEMTWIETFTGKRIDLLDPSPDDIDIADIAQALSNLCRFTGHCSRFYSVAEHSMWVASAVFREGEVAETVMLAALLHDATEAYVADLSRPAKQALRALVKESKLKSETPGLNEGSSYDVLESRIARAIARKFTIPYKMPPLVKEMDTRILVTEQRVLMKRNDWNLGVEPVLLAEFKAAPIHSPGEVALRFLKAFEELTG